MFRPIGDLSVRKLWGTVCEIMVNSQAARMAHKLVTLCELKRMRCIMSMYNHPFLLHVPFYKLKSGTEFYLNYRRLIPFLTEYEAALLLAVPLFLYVLQPRLREKYILVHLQPPMAHIDIPISVMKYIYYSLALNAEIHPLILFLNRILVPQKCNLSGSTVARLPAMHWV